MKNKAMLSLISAVLLLCGTLPAVTQTQTTSAQAQTGSIHGTVADPSGAVVPSATVTLTSQSGASKFALSGGDGAFVIDSLEPGSYTISVSAEGFAPFDPLAVEVVAGKSVLQNIALQMPIETQKVTVSDQGLSVDTSADNNASAIVIKGKDLDALSDDPDELQNELTRSRRPRGRTQRRANLHRRLYRRTAPAQVLHPRDPHQSESVLGAVRQAGLRPH